ncbi:MAG: DNA-binding protein [Prochlorotrichaceae cyanobacterium]
MDLGKDVLRGEVLDVYELSSKRGLRSDTYLLLRTLLRTLGQVWEVQLAPETYLEAQDFDLEPEDWVEITGQRFGRRGQSTFLAFTVASGEKTLVLRNEQGRPLW